MTLDTLIATLQALRETHGGAIEVATFNREYDSYFPVTDVEFCDYTVFVSPPCREEGRLGQRFISLC